MEKLIESLINKIYHLYCQQHYQLIATYAPFLSKYLPQHLITFAGFEFSYDTYGHTSHRECYLLGGTKIYEHTIYLNSWFFDLLKGKRDIPEEYDFPHLIKVIAHEVAHCLVFDFYSLEKGHVANHSLITQKLEDLLRNDNLVNKLQTKLNEVKLNR